LLNGELSIDVFEQSLRWISFCKQWEKDDEITGEYSHISFFEGHATLAWYNQDVYVLFFENGTKEISWHEKQITETEFIDCFLTK
jgi:hypothetical protein